MAKRDPVKANQPKEPKPSKRRAKDPAPAPPADVQASSPTPAKAPTDGKAKSPLPPADEAKLQAIAAPAGPFVAEEHVWQAENGNRRVVYVTPGTPPVAPDARHALLKELNKIKFDSAEALAKALSGAHA